MVNLIKLSTSYAKRYASYVFFCIVTSSHLLILPSNTIEQAEFFYTYLTKINVGKNLKILGKISGIERKF
jgi:hypothetical protein